MLANPALVRVHVQPATGVLVLRRRRRRCACVIAEVHNTYGERHCYLLRPDAHGQRRSTRRSTCRRSSHVDGRYEMQFTEPRRASSTSAITLRRGRPTVFRPSLARCRPARRGPSVRRRRRAAAPVRRPAGDRADTAAGDPPVAPPRADRPPSRPSAPTAGGRARADRRTMTAPPSSECGAPRPRAVATSSAPRPRPVHTAIARSLFFRAIAEDADPGASSPTARVGRRRRPDAPGDARPAATRSSDAARERRPDRFRRVVHGRRLGRRRSRRHARSRSPSAHDQAGARRGCSGCATSTCGTNRRREENTIAGARQQHRAPLRPVERPVLALPRRVDDVLVGAGSMPGDTLESAQAARSTGCSTRSVSALGTRLLEIGTGWGSLAIRAARRGATVTTLTLSQRAAGARPPAGRRRRRRAIASTSSCATTATRRASTTRSSASR